MNKSRLLQFKDAALQSNVLVASIDCFDTLLLRQPKSEAMRWLEISADQVKALNEYGIDCSASPKEITRLRIMATRLWMRDASVRDLSQQPMYNTILSMIASDLNLPAKAEEILQDAELQYELNFLTPNRLLIGILQDLMNKGKKVISISDMYLSADQIKYLIQSTCKINGSLTVYSSGDLGVTKAMGDIYRKVLHLEGIEANSMVHTGDSKQSDVVMARRHGIRAIHMPREWTHRAGHFAYRTIGKLQTLVHFN